jgi:hypothetical protein
MPAYTRYQMNAINRAVPVARLIEFNGESAKVTVRNHVNNNGERWTQQEERDLVSMLRHDNLSVAEVASALHRSPLAIHYRIDKVLTEHIGEDDVGVLEASKWLHPHISARQMSEDFKSHIAAFKAKTETAARH